MIRILLVDDEEDLVSALAERLILRGFDVDWVTSVRDAIKSTEKKTYDIALLDVKLPGLSGIELKKKLEEISPGLKYIFMTGHGSQDDFVAGSGEAGRDYYLAKPLKIDMIIEKINELVKE